MTRPMDKKEAKRIIKEHRSVLTQLSKVTEHYECMRGSITDVVSEIINKETLVVLSNTDINELNRDKRGFRVKSLRDNGYSTIADVYNASVSALSSINGISQQNADEIKKCANDLYETASKSVKIKLNVDNKTAEYTQLVQVLSKYKVYDPYAKNCFKIYNENSNLISTAISQLAPATSSLKWMFTSSEKKGGAQAAFDTLSLLLLGDYFKSATENITLYKKVKSVKIDVWQDFSNEPVKYYNIIEDICPDVLGKEDSVYGLPEELALAIQEQPLLTDGLKCQLRRYQEWGAKYTLKQKRVLLGDEMGLGKTVQAIASMVSLRNNGCTHFIVVCPASVVSNWCREITKMSDLTAIKIHGSDKNESLNKWINDGGVAVTTFETTGLFQFHDSFKFDLLVVDEAHYIKNPKAQRTNNVKSFCDNANMILFMTGTALENKVEEMISLIDILKPEVASSVSGMEFLSSAPEFRKKVAPVYYRRRREDVLTELPELIETKEWCTLNSAEEKVYEDTVLNGSFADVRRVSWNVSNIKKSSKATRLLELVEEAQEDGRKVIVFSYFLDTINKVMSLLGDKCIGPINGSVPPQKRQEIVDEFNDAPAGTVLAAQIQAGGTGLNIQSASVVILCEPQFKPSIENQAVSRAYRMGQTRNVLVHRLLCDDTVDEKITELLESKQAVFDAFADESVVADESFELDEKTFGAIITEEAERINNKNKS